MGLLKRIKSDDEFYLETHNLIGRGARCSLIVDSKYASNEHLALDWIDNKWYVRDLGTTNGTYIDNVPVEPKNPRKFGLGQCISIGEAKECWKLVEASEPQPMAVSVGPGKRNVQQLSHGTIVLPSPGKPEAAIFQDSEESWILEQHGDKLSIETDQFFSVCGEVWRFSLPHEWHITSLNRDHLLLENAAFTFLVSSDEETVKIVINVEGQEISISNHSHNYMLLTLARERLSSEARDGWLSKERLKKMLKADERAINVWIFRARKSLSEVGFLRPAGIVERENGMIRIGVENITVKKLE
jgi:hypothetical protein